MLGDERGVLPVLPAHRAARIPPECDSARANGTVQIGACPDEWDEAAKARGVEDCGREPTTSGSRLTTPERAAPSRANFIPHRVLLFIAGLDVGVILRMKPLFSNMVGVNMVGVQLLVLHRLHHLIGLGCFCHTPPLSHSSASNRVERQQERECGPFPDTRCTRRGIVTQDRCLRLLPGDVGSLVCETACRRAGNAHHGTIRV